MNAYELKQILTDSGIQFPGNLVDIANSSVDTKQACREYVRTAALAGRLDLCVERNKFYKTRNGLGRVL